jgi:catechol 2,3-dioxygenase-like lactoylglutathione lyase family enzyme
VSASERVILSGAGVEVTDLAKSLDFYREAFGLVEERRISFPGAEESVLGGAGEMVLLLGCREGSVPRTDQSLLSRLIFHVSDVEAICSRVLAASGTVVREPRVRSSGEQTFKIAHVADPDGNGYEIVEEVVAGE